MKNLLKSLLIILCFFTLSCSPVKRATWYYKQAIKLNPTLVTTFDTTIEITDTTYLKGDTISLPCKDTVFQKGKVKVVIKDKIITVLTPNDTIVKSLKVFVKGKSYPVFNDKPFYKEKMFLPSLVLLLLCLCLGMFLVVAIQIKNGK